MQMSTTHNSFDQYCISHKTINHRAASAPGPEARREATPLVVRIRRATESSLRPTLVARELNVAFVTLRAGDKLTA